MCGEWCEAIAPRTGIDLFTDAIGFGLCEPFFGCYERKPTTWPATAVSSDRVDLFKVAALQTVKFKRDVYFPKIVFAVAIQKCSEKGGMPKKGRLHFSVLFPALEDRSDSGQILS